MLIAIGAEAEIHLTEWFNRKAISKWRLPKPYRNKIIDEHLRKSRTRTEAKLIAEVKKYGISAPIIYDINLEENMIVMEYIDGEKVKDILNNASAEKRLIVCRKIGKSIATMHKNDIIHGDLTTSNMLLKDDKLYFIDFGLGEKSKEIEKKGVDLHVLWEAFKSAHTEIMSDFMYVLESYKLYEKNNEIIKKMYEISERGRYA